MENMLLTGAYGFGGEYSAFFYLLFIHFQRGDGMS
jgi:hypothetical protein